MLIYDSFLLHTSAKKTLIVSNEICSVAEEEEEERENLLAQIR